MSKRIFTRYMTGEFSDQGTTWKEILALDSWLLQEDIEVIGYQIGTRVHIADQNDNLTEVIGELSQTAIFGQDGVIGRVCGAHLWNSVPSSVDRECPTSLVMFPQGTAIPVKEEGHIYLNASVKGAALTHAQWAVWAIIYYTKKGK